MHSDKWPDNVPVGQSVLNQASSAQRRSIAPATTLIGADTPAEMLSFIRSTAYMTTTVADVQNECVLNIVEIE